MKRLRVIRTSGAFVLLIMISFIFVGANAGEIHGPYVPNELIVRYVDEGSGKVSSAVASSLNNQIGAQPITPVQDFDVPGMQVVEIPQTTTMTDAIAHYENNPLVKYAEPNYVLSIAEYQTIPDDPYFPLQWGLYNSSSSVNSTANTTSSVRADIYAPEAWNVTTGSPDIIVAVIDTGVDYTHEDLKGNLLEGYDLVNNDRDPMDCMPLLHE